MKNAFALLLATLPGMVPQDAPAGKTPGPNVVTLYHKTLPWTSEGTHRYELSGTISGNGGQGKLWRTTVPGGINIFGDRVEDGTTTEHNITLERLNPEKGHGIDRLATDTSPKRDRTLYRIKGIDLGTNRQLLLLVSPAGPQRLIHVGRCGGFWATTLESRSAFDGPVTKAK